MAGPGLRLQDRACEIDRLRDKAKAALGARFDLRTFDDAVVLGGNVPMTLLESVIDRYIAEAKA